MRQPGETQRKLRVGRCLRAACASSSLFFSDAGRYAACDFRIGRSVAHEFLIASRPLANGEPIREAREEHDEQKSGLVEVGSRCRDQMH